MPTIPPSVPLVTNPDAVPPVGVGNGRIDFADVVWLFNNL